MKKYSTEKFNQIWEKASIVNNDSKDEWRKDYAGAWIHKSDYGQETDYGWEVDHAKPSSKGGSDEINNLVPLLWMNNRTKGDNYPSFKTSISSEGTRNIESVKSWDY